MDEDAAEKALRSTTLSGFKEASGRDRLLDWCYRVRRRSSTTYESKAIPTRFGETHVWSHVRGGGRVPLVVLPGFRTCGLIWDIDDAVASLARVADVYLVDVIGQPGLSSGITPAIRGKGYGIWLCDLLDGLNLRSAHWVGASFGGLLQFKLAQVAPERMLSASMINPVGLRGVTTSLAVMWESFRPLFGPNESKVRRFVDRVVLAGGEGISSEARALLDEYVLLSIREHRHRGGFPYQLSDEEIRPMTAPIRLFLGDSDRLIPQRPTVDRAKKHFPTLASPCWLPGHGHGAEVSRVTLAAVADRLMVS